MSSIETVPVGWIIDIKQPCCFNKALEDLVGASYEIVLCLGYQVVAGTNYKFLVTFQSLYWAILVFYL